MPCVPVAPSTKVRNTVSSVELFATAVMFVASVAVAELPVHEPDEPLVLPVTLPVRFPVTLVVVKTPDEGL